MPLPARFALDDEDGLPALAQGPRLRLAPGPTAYELTDQGIIAKSSTIALCISLLYPPSQFSYEQKEDALLFTFEKFTTQRHHPLQKSIRVFESSDLNIYSKALYQDLADYTSLEYTEDATLQELTDSITYPYSAFFVHGHSNPSGTDISKDPHTGWFPTETLTTLTTPFFGADGCYVAGWWSLQKDNNHLDESTGTSWYGARSSPVKPFKQWHWGCYRRMDALSQSVSCENAMPELLSGKTLAESLLGDTTLGDTIIIGDPSFHYTL